MSLDKVGAISRKTSYFLKQRLSTSLLVPSILGENTELQQSWKVDELAL